MEDGGAREGSPGCLRSCATVGRTDGAVSLPRVELEVWPSIAQLDAGTAPRDVRGAAALLHRCSLEFNPRVLSGAYEGMAARAGLMRLRDLDLLDQLAGRGEGREAQTDSGNSAGRSAPPASVTSALMAVQAAFGLYSGCTSQLNDRRISTSGPQPVDHG
jgi:hypothetical protein